MYASAMSQHLLLAQRIGCHYQHIHLHTRLVLARLRAVRDSNELAADGEGRIRRHGLLEGGLTGTAAGEGGHRVQRFK